MNFIGVLVYLRGRRGLGVSAILLRPTDKPHLPRAASARLYWSKFCTLAFATAL